MTLSRGQSALRTIAIKITIIDLELHNYNYSTRTVWKKRYFGIILTKDLTNRNTESRHVTRKQTKKPKHTLISSLLFSPPESWMNIELCLSPCNVHQLQLNNLCFTHHRQYAFPRRRRWRCCKCWCGPYSFTSHYLSLCGWPFGEVFLFLFCGPNTYRQTKEIHKHKVQWKRRTFSLEKRK